MVLRSARYCAWLLLAVVGAVIWQLGGLQQKHAVRELLQRGASVTVDATGCNQTLRCLINHEYIGRVTRIDFGRVRPDGFVAQIPVADADTEGIVAGLNSLRGPKTVVVAGWPLTDFGVATIARCKTPIDVLDLSETRCSDDSIEALATMPALKELDLSKTGVTNAGLQRLRALRPGLVLKNMDWTKDSAGRVSLK